MTTIGKYAFSSCSSLTSAVIGNSVTEIDHYTFQGCINLTAITIPNSITDIGYRAFEGCTSLTSITIPNGTYIGQYAFENCTSLTSVSIGQTYSAISNSMTEIDKDAFSRCNGLTNVTLNNSMINIKEYAFRSCNALTTIIFGSNVTEISGERYTFSICRGLKDFYCLAENAPTIDELVLLGMRIGLLTLHVPATSVKTYSITEPWSNFGQIVPIDESNGIELRSSEDFTSPTVYDLNGRRTTKMQKSIRLLRNADGRIKKVLRK